MSKSQSAAVLIVLVLAASCASQPSTPAKPMTIAEMPNIDANAALADIKKLASDEFQGRAPDGGEWYALAVR